MIKDVILSIILACSLFFSIEGFVFGTYILITILSLNVVLVAFSATVLMGLQVYMLENSGNFLANIKAKDKGDHVFKFIIRLMLLVSVWHLYTVGYVFFSGVAATTVLISLSVVAIEYLNKKFTDH